jgi:hypothetical protein
MELAYLAPPRHPRDIRVAFTEPGSPAAQAGVRAAFVDRRRHDVVAGPTWRSQRWAGAQAEGDP